MPRGHYSTDKKRGRPKGALNVEMTVMQDKRKFDVGPVYAVTVTSRGGVRNSDEQVDQMEM